MTERALLLNVQVERMHTVTILLATYNGEKYLREQLDSLLTQKGVRVSILVRDDKSTDGTQHILDEYQKKGYLTWYTGEHLNVPNGYLDLLKHVGETDYYAFCDQDDVWDEDKLLIAVSKLDEMKQDMPAMYYCGQRLVDENMKLLSIHNVNNERSHHTNFLISNVAGCTAVFNRPLVDCVNSVDPDFILMHDSWLFKVCLATISKYDQLIHQHRPGRPWYEKILMRFCEFTNFGQRINTKKAKYQVEKVMMKYSPRSEKYAVNFWPAYKFKEEMPIEWYGEGKYLPFESILIHVPNEPERILEKLYGDYMQLPPENQRNIQHCMEIVLL